MDNLKIHERFTIRHQILSRLHQAVKYDEKHNPDLRTAWMDIRNLAKSINVPLDKVQLYHHALHNDKQVSCNPSGNMSIIRLEENGLHAFIDEYWIEQGEKALLERRQINSVIATNRLQRWSFWASLFTALTALVISVLGLNKEDENIINPAIVLKDTLIESKYKDTLQLQIQLHQPSDTSK